MDRTIYSFKAKLLINLPPFISKLLYSINHKPVLFNENKYGVDFSIYIPHTMLANYNNGHEVGVAKRVIENYKARPNMVFWDVGSCFSYFSAMVNALSPNARLYAFEPFVGHYLYIEKSKKKNLLGQLTLTKKFVGAEAAPNTITLDSFCEKSGTVPTLIKIDVDGAEMGVLDGAKNIITKHKPDFLIEVDCNKYKTSHRVLGEFLDKYFKDYHCSVLLDVHKNNTVWTEEDVHSIEIAPIQGDIYLHLVPKK